MSADTQTATIAPARPLPAVAPVSPAPAPSPGAPRRPSTAVRLLRRHAVHLIAAAAVVATYAVAQLPSTPSAEQAALAARYRFTPISIELPAGLPQQSIRQVNPAYERIQAWISSVGAAVALTDLDGDGLANDMCYVDPRVDRAIVAPAPVGAPRYPAFAVDTAGLAAGPTIAPMGCLPGDYNDDGRTDLLVYYWGRTPTLHIATSTGTPRVDGYRATELIPGSSQRWFTNAATQADLDGDGRLDLILGNYFPDDSRVLDASASPADVTMQHSMSRAFNGGRDHLLLRTGGPGTVGFRDASDALPRDVAEGWTLAVGAADLDGDQLPELYLAQDFGPDRLLHNRSTPGQLRFAPLRGERGLATPASKVLGRDSFKGMGVDFADLNGDGRLDMFVSNITEEYALQESNFVWVSTGETGRMAHGVAPYVERSEELGLARTGWGWDTRLVDLDNDGVSEALQAVGFVAGRVNRWPEVQELALGNDELLAHPGAWPALRPGTDLSGDGGVRFFARDSAGRFTPLADRVGLGQVTVSRGLATGDVDGDGDLDLAVANQWAAPVFYRNDCPDCGASLALDLVRPAGDGTTPAIGAQATVYDARGRRLVAQVDGGNGHSGKRSPELAFGLGGAGNGPVRVDLTWRDISGQVHAQTIQVTPGRHTIRLTDTATEGLGR